MEVNTANDFVDITSIISFYKDRFADDPEVLMHLISSNYVTAGIYAVHVASRKSLPYLVNAESPVVRSALRRRMNS